VCIYIFLYVCVQSFVGSGKRLLVVWFGDTREGRNKEGGNKRQTVFHESHVSTDTYFLLKVNQKAFN